MSDRTIAMIMGVLLLAGILWVGWRSNILRDTSQSPRPPFSFSRTQLMWWTSIVAFCFLAYFGTHGELPAVTASCLAVLGIGVGTTGTAWIIDDQQRATATRAGLGLHRDRPSVGFFTDLLSDADGLSVHRFQALVFNVIFGVSFLVHFVWHGFEFPAYGVMEYAVLGLSSAGYLGLKALEQGDETAAVTAKTAGEGAAP